MYIYNKWFYIWLSNPLKKYNIIKRYFKPLKPCFHFIHPWNYYDPTKVMKLVSTDVGWKSKWDSPRHEYNPRFVFMLFGIGIHIEWKYFECGEDRSMEYWEAALDWMCFNKPLSQAFEDNTGWITYDKDGNEVKKTYYFLREPYQDMYNKGQALNIYCNENITD